MQKIFQLSPEEAQKIAAGEVVERPANIVKELVENSLDAGATKISIYLKNGGQTFIRIIDNGCGMNPDDAERSFLKHATSKIKSVHELHDLTTFGFRGEALASISAVSKVILQTKEVDAHEGIKIKRQGLMTESKEYVGCPTGTEIIVEDLFYNVPARKKFLKQEETEWRAVAQLFQALCLDYQTIHFQLYHNDALVHNCPPTRDLNERMIQLFGHTLNSHLITLEKFERSAITISGIISDTQLWRYNRNQLFLFVNKRWMKNYELSRALTKAYANSLPKDRYPLGALFISLDPSAVDVNIHPRKEEVKFLNPRIVETALFEAIKQALERTLQQSLSAPRSHEIPAPAPLPTFATTAPSSRPFAFSSVQTFSPQKFQEPFIPPKLSSSIPQQTPAPFIPLEEEEIKLIGIMHNTYLLIEHKDGLFFIDQHAAHERVLYEQFAKRFKQVPTIQLLFAQTIDLPAHDVLSLMKFKQTLEDHGIELDQLADNQIAVKATPVHLKHINFTHFIKDIVEEVKALESIEETELFDTLHKKLRAQMACKAAVKAGDALSTQQALQLIRDLYACDNKLTCPHGRPTGWLMSLYEVEKKFKRV